MRARYSLVAFRAKDHRQKLRQALPTKINDDCVAQRLVIVCLFGVRADLDEKLTFHGTIRELDFKEAIRYLLRLH